MNSDLARVAALLEAETGIHVKAPQLPSLAAALARVSPGLTAARFLDSVSEDSLLAPLVDQVAVQETYFLREPEQLETIEWDALAAAAHLRGDEAVRIWICACASGEEAYSVAMLAIEAFGTAWPPVSIVATDISQRALARARQGEYNERAMREVDGPRRERFFVENDRRSVVGADLRALVSFRPHNLVSEPGPPVNESRFDLILCRNVLIYFGADTAAYVVRSLESALQPSGHLILGAADRLTVSAQRLARVAAGAEKARPSASKAAKRPRAERPRVRRPRDVTQPARAKPVTARAQPQARVVADAQAAADAGNLAEAIAITDEILARDPLDPEAYFVRGLAELASGDAAGASESLRRALYIDPGFALAAFQLGRAQDLRGDERAARRAYRQALSSLAEGGGEGHEALRTQVHVGDIATACRARLAGAPSSRTRAVAKPN